MKIWVALLIFCLPALTVAQRTIELNDSATVIYAGKMVRIFTDEQCSYSFSEILAKNKSIQWMESIEVVPNYGVRSSATWIHFSIKNHSKNKKWMLHIEYPILEHIELYYFDSLGNALVKKGGSSIPHALWEVQDRGHTFYLPINNMLTSDLYLRVASQTSTTIPLSIMSEQYYYKWVIDGQLLLGAFYGTLFIMMLYNLILYFSTKDIVYCYYVFYLFSFALYQFTFDGLGYQYLWPDATSWNTSSISFIYGFHFIFGALFVKTFLQVKYYSLILNQILNFEILFGALITLLSVMVPYPYPNKMGLWSLFFFIPVHIFIGIYIYLKGFQPSKYFLLASSVLAFGMVSRAGRGLGLFAVSFWTTYGWQIGSFLEVVLLSFALANKIKILKQEKRIEMNKLRSEISSDLHDEIGSNLGSISLISQSLKRYPQIDNYIKEQLQEITDTTLQTSENLRDIIWFITPVKRTAEEFITNLRSITEKQLRNIEFNFNYTLPEDYEFTNLFLQRNLYLMYKEVLHNIVKHSCATIVMIEIAIQKEGVELSIKDNGKGFDLFSSRNGMGLKNLEKRAKTIEADLKINSSDHQGTEISIKKIAQTRYMSGPYKFIFLLQPLKRLHYGEKKQV